MLSLVVSVGIPTAAAVDFIFTEGDWNVPTNWSGGQLPTAGDPVRIPNAKATIPAGFQAWANTLDVGTAGGDGSLEIPGGLLITQKTVVGPAQGAGSALMSDGRWTATDFLVGDRGQGDLTLTGGSIVSKNSSIGGQSLVTIAGGTWMNGQFEISSSLTGHPPALLLQRGTVSSDSVVIAPRSGSSGVARIQGGRWNLANDLQIGYRGAGSLFLYDEGTVAGGKGEKKCVLALAAGSTGTLSMGIGGATGTLLVSEVSGGEGKAYLVFNHSWELFFMPLISGSTMVEHKGHGVTTLPRENTYTGGTVIQIGTLNLANETGSATGTGSVSIAKGGVLSGFGRAGGAVTLGYGGTIKPASGDLHLGSLHWDEGSRVAIEVGPEAPHLIVDGPLTRGEAGFYGLELTSADSLQSVAYPLIEFASTDFAAGDFAVRGLEGQLVIRGRTLYFIPGGPAPELVRRVGVEASGGRRLAATFAITNAGDLPDQYRLSESRRVIPRRGEGNGRNRSRIDCRFLVNGKDMTRAVERGRALTAELAPGERALVQMKVDVLRPLHRSKRLISTLTARSIQDRTVATDANVEIELPGLEDS